MRDLHEDWLRHVALSRYRGPNDLALVRYLSGSTMRETRLASLLGPDRLPISHRMRRSRAARDPR